MVPCPVAPNSIRSDRIPSPGLDITRRLVPERPDRDGDFSVHPVTGRAENPDPWHDVRTFTASATRSRTCSPASRTGGASQHDTTDARILFRAALVLLVRFCNSLRLDLLTCNSAESEWRGRWSLGRNRVKRVLLNMSTPLRQFWAARIGRDLSRIIALAY